MVFNYHPIFRYPSGLPEELLRIMGMMQDIDEGNDIERAVVIRDCAPIESSNWNLGLRADKDINSLYREIGSSLPPGISNRTISRTNIEDGSIPGQKIAYCCTEYACTSGKN
jgi:hypothetical protein